jgi:hypothetical protein
MFIALQCVSEYNLGNKGITINEDESRMSFFSYPRNRLTHRSSSTPPICKRRVQRMGTITKLEISGFITLSSLTTVVVIPFVVPLAVVASSLVIDGGVVLVFSEAMAGPLTQLRSLMRQ